MNAIQVHEPGPADNMKLEEVPIPQPASGEVLVRVTAAGVNFIDVYHRNGQYPIPERPFRIGMEGAGIVESTGPDVTEIKPGEKVAWAMVRGSYAEYAIVPAAKLVVVPDEVEVPTAAQMMLQGMTAHYLTRSTFRLKEGDTCLVHAAAGGVGLMIVQMAKIAGARVIGTVGSDYKAEQAKSAGADEIILYRSQDFVEEVKKLTDGRGVDVVYDGVGKTTFEGSLNCLRPRGMMVLFGASSGPVPKFDLQVLNQKGALFITRPSLGHYCLTREELLGRARDIFQWKIERKLQVFSDRSYPLADAPQAHKDLERRKTSGKLTLTMS
jgi:NADPH2:quinone reductase